jgi:hypothetical protein
MSNHQVVESKKLLLVTQNSKLGIEIRVPQNHSEQDIDVTKKRTELLQDIGRVMSVDMQNN